jgi:hypothetical protein
MPTATASGSIGETTGNGHVSFSELVRAHHEWDASGAHTADAVVERRYRELLATFEAGAGEIVDAYWCRRVASAVALTRRERQIRKRRRKLEYRLHRVSDWVTEDTHEIAGEDPPDPKAVKRFAAAERAELERIEDYYFRAGEKRAKMRYVEGMIGLGMLFLFINALGTAAILALFGALDLESASVREFYASAAAGGFGAVISALMRMSGRGEFVIDHEMTRLEVTLVGAYRPLIGSVSGIVVYFLLKTPLIPLEEGALTLPLFVVVAFLAGFSERWTRMVLDGAMRTIGSQQPATDAPAKEERKEQVEAPAVTT